MDLCTTVVNIQTINANMEEGWATIIEVVIMADNTRAALEEVTKIKVHHKSADLSAAMETSLVEVTHISNKKMTSKSCSSS